MNLSDFTYYMELNKLDSIITPDTVDLLESLKHSDSLQYAFWLSVFLLVLISLLKYFISKDSEKQDWGFFILEFPIDVCLVVITIIITGYMKEENLAYGVILVVISLIVSIMCCIFRRLSINKSFEDNQYACTFIYGLLDIVIASGWIFFVYNQIV